jgi:hypothetical protein
MTALASVIVKTTTADSALNDAGAWAAIAAAGIAFVLLLAAVFQWYRRRARVQTLTRLIAAGIALRQRLYAEKPDALAMGDQVNEWLDQVQDEARKRASNALPDVQAAVVESLNRASIDGLDERQSGLLMRIDHVLRVLRRYVAQG